MWFRIGTGKTTLEQHIAALAEKVLGSNCSPAFFSRYAFAQRLISNRDEEVKRPISAPNYVSDLGVRQFSDPAAFLQAHLDIAEKPFVFSGEQITAELSELPLEQLSSYIDYTILMTGDYSAVARMINKRYEEIAGSFDYYLLIYAGTVLAATSSEKCLPLFDAAAREAETLYEAYGAQHRAAAFEIKRTVRPNDGLNRLLRAKELYLTGQSAEDALNTALFFNLEALGRMMTGEADGHEEIERSKEWASVFHSADSLSEDLASRAARYESQIAINEAQVAIQGSDAADAVEILRRNAARLELAEPDYYPEALAAWAYALFLNNEYELAIDVSVEAFWRYSMNRSYFWHARGARDGRCMYVCDRATCCSRENRKVYFN